MSTFDTRREQSKIVFAKSTLYSELWKLICYRCCIEPLNNGVIQESTCSVLMVFPSKATRSEISRRLLSFQTLAL
nr:hypothetical protein [Tanacetum cinerariifolium]